MYPYFIGGVTISILEKIFGREESQKQTENQKTKYPLAELEKCVGEMIEVHHLDLNIPKITTETLKCPPNEVFFYLEKGSHSHLVYWDDSSFNGQRTAVKLIKDHQGKVIYENKEIPFDYQKLKDNERSKLNQKKSA